MVESRGCFKIESLQKKLRFSQYIVFYTKVSKIKLSNSSQQDYNCPIKRKPHRCMEAFEQKLNDLCMEILEMICHFFFTFEDFLILL